MALMNPLLGSNLVGTGQAPFDTTLIGNSVWLDGSADGLTAPSSTFSAQDGKEFTLGTWFQLNQIGVSEGLFCAGANPYTSLRHDSDNKIYFQTEAGSAILKTQAVFRDIGWYHILVSVDTTQSAAGNRVRLFVNGTEQTLDGTQPSVNHVYEFNTAVVHEVGDSFENGAFKGYLAQSFMIGSKSIQQGDFAITDFLDTYTFGTNGSQFIPKKHSEIKTLVDAGSSNSFLLQYENSSALGTDSSTNTNTFTATSMGSANQSSNTPSNSYPVLNVLDLTTATASSGNLNFAGPSADNKAAMRTTIGIPDNSGKFYFEYEMTGGSNDALMFGIAGDGSANDGYDDFVSDITPSIAVYTENGSNKLYVDGSVTTSSLFGSAPSSGDIIGVAYDSATRKVWFALNNTYAGSGDPAAGSGETATLSSSGTAFPTVSARGSSDTLTLRFDSDDFSHSAPTGYNELNTANLTAPTYQGIDYFDATLYEGNGGGQRVGDFVPFTDAYTVTNSVMFDDGDSRSLSLNPSSSATSSTVAAISLWLKLGNLGTYGRPYTIRVDGNNYFGIAHDGDDKLSFVINNGGATILNRTTTRIFKDTSAWHNLVVIINQGNGTQADRVKIFYDGVQIPNDSTNFSPNTCSLDGSSALNFLNDSSAVHDIGGGVFSQHYDGYVAEVVFLDGADSGSKLDATPFGQVDTSTNRWVTKDPGSYTFGNMGYYLEFKVAPGTNNGAGTDTSGRDNHFTSNGSWATSDQFTDAPSKNFNVFDGGLNGAGTLSEGNTQITTATNQRTTYTTMNIPATGKWYWEVDVTNYVSGGGSFLGIVEFDELVTGNNPNNGLERKVIFDNFAGNAYVYSTTSLGTTWCNTPGNNNFNANGDILQFALDQDAGTLFIGNNNTWFRAGGARDSFANATTVGQQTFNTGVKRRFLIGRGGSFNETYAINFGQQANTFSGSSTTFNADADGFFVYTPPTDYKALNQDNLDDTASKITAWAWIKNRDASDNHILVDRVRGTGKDIHSNSTDAEATNANTVQRFLQRGVQVGNNVEVNTSGESYVLWQWLLGDSATTGSTNSEGSLNTSVIAADAGHFSVVSWTMSDPAAAKTLGHGLSGAPELIIVKNRTDAGTNWPVFSEAAGNTKYQYLSTTAAAATFNMWQNTSPTSTVFSVNSNNEASGSANDEMIAYCFRSVPGVCKVSKYTGNGDSTDGPYISLGFTPRYILIKNIDAAQNWLIWDTARSSYNPLNNTLFADLNSGESTSSTYGRDILSDGFKLRGSSHAIVNASGNNYLYMAMADIGGNGRLPPVYGR